MLRRRNAAEHFFCLGSKKEGDEMEKRLGFVGIIIEDREANAPEVNALLGDFGNIIVARMGVPYEKRSCSAITLIVDATTDELGVLTGKLGNLPGVSVKSMLSKPK
jgi:putative iron-only hydrogenase system regulator